MTGPNGSLWHSWGEGRLSLDVSPAAVRVHEEEPLFLPRRTAFFFAPEAYRIDAVVRTLVQSEDNRGGSRGHYAFRSFAGKSAAVRVRTEKLVFFAPSGTVFFCSARAHKSGRGLHWL